MRGDPCLDMAIDPPPMQNARMVKRGYSKDFTPHGNTGKRYLLDEIPAGLWSAAKAKAKREGVSMRALILQLLRDWIAK